MGALRVDFVNKLAILAIVPGSWPAPHTSCSSDTAMTTPDISRRATAHSLAAMMLALKLLPPDRFPCQSTYLIAPACVGCILLGVFTEATLFRIAKFDEIDFFNQSLGAVLAGVVACGLCGHRETSRTGLRRWADHRRGLCFSRSMLCRCIGHLHLRSYCCSACFWRPETCGLPHGDRRFRSNCTMPSSGKKSGAKNTRDMTMFTCSTFGRAAYLKWTSTFLTLSTKANRFRSQPGRETCSTESTRLI